MTPGLIKEDCMTDIKYKQGDFNEIPAGWREINEGQFAQSMFFTYTPVAHEYRQIFPPGEPHVLDIKMFHMHDGTGFAMYSDYWGKKVRYFAFGCEHEWGGKLTDAEKAITVYNCTSKCKKCGYFHATR